MSYDQITEAIKEAPQTWLPALLKTVVDACLDRKVFVDGGIERYVAKAIEKHDPGLRP